MNEMLLAELSDAGQMAIRATAWVAALVLLVIAAVLARRSPAPVLRQLAWLLAVPAILLACYGTPPVWTQIETIASAAWSNALGPIWNWLGPLANQPFAWGLGFGAFGLWFALPTSNTSRRLRGLACGVVALGFFAGAVPWMGGWAPQAFYIVLATVTVGSAAIAICSRSPVYSAIWFAICLAGVSGLFVYNGAQFLGAATIVVYAGAIIVTFLFVVMLAQPEGQATYDRISWAGFPQPLSLIAASILVGALAFAVGGDAELQALQRDLSYSVGRVVESESMLEADNVATLGWTSDRSGWTARVRLRGETPPESLERMRASLEEVFEGRAVTVDVAVLEPHQDVLHPRHMANFGARLFGVHTLAIEMTGALLLVALVGAIAIVIHGRESAGDDRSSSE